MYAVPSEPSRASTDRPLAIVDLDGVLADVRHRLTHIEGARTAWARFSRRCASLHRAQEHDGKT